MNSVYDLSGGTLLAIYESDGSELLTAYDVDGNAVFNADVFDVFADYEDAISNSVIPNVLEPISADFGTLQYVGGICVNNKIYCTPNSADDILVYDIAEDEPYKIGSGLGTNQFKYTGQIYYNDKVYMLHRGVNNMIEIDPSDDSYRLIPLDLGYTVNPYGDYRDSYQYNGVISNKGFLYQPPAYNNTDLLKINMRTFAVEKIPFTSAQTGTWIGCVKHPTQDKIIFLSSKVFRVWDCATDTYIDVYDGTTRACYDMVYDPRYNCFIGVYPNHFFALMLDDYTIIDSDYRNYSSTGYGISIGLDGRYYHLEGSNAYYAIFDGEAFVSGAMQYIAGTGNFGDATPYIAGQAIDTDGSIYGIPASGNMSRLSFKNVLTALDARTVSSQWYGKY